MRGKKADTVFISQFVSECIKEGFTTSDEIVKRAKHQLDQIDLEILAIENKKKTRSQLLDVILAFEKQTKDKTKEADKLSFYDLADQNNCRHICGFVKHHPFHIDEQRLNHDERFALKQLIERKIIARDWFSTMNIIQGERYNEYMQFILYENK